LLNFYLIFIALNNTIQVNIYGLTRKLDNNIINLTKQKSSIVMVQCKRVAEKKIKEALENKEFEDLEGFGEPIDNSEYFKTPEEDRMAFHILKNAGVVPEELKIRKNINALLKDIKACSDIEEKERLKKELYLLYSQYELAMEHRKLKKIK